MTCYMERFKELEQKRSALREEVGKPETTTERINAIRHEAEGINKELEELRSRMDLSNSLLPGAPLPAAAGAGQQRSESALEKRAAAFRSSGHLTMPLFAEQRSLLVSSGKLATPTAVATEIGELEDAISSIVDDVDTIDATGTASWEFPYKTAGAVAADHTEGSEYGGTGADFDKVAISGSDWGVLDSVSEQVAKQTNVNYMTAVQNSALKALRKTARDKITAAVLGSDLLEKRYSVALDQKYLRNIILNFGGDESVSGGTKLYLCKEDLITLGDVRGTNEKKTLYEITFTDGVGNNGTIKEGGMSIPFSILSSLSKGQQLYGQPKSIKQLLWGDYEIRTDMGGDYFRKGLIGIRANAMAGAGLVVKGGMQLIHQAAQS